jgi:hypothetical protein
MGKLFTRYWAVVTVTQEAEDHLCMRHTMLVDGESCDMAGAQLPIELEATKLFTLKRCLYFKCSLGA